MSLGRNCSNWNKVTVYSRVDIRGVARRDVTWQEVEGQGGTRAHFEDSIFNGSSKIQ